MEILCRHFRLIYVSLLISRTCFVFGFLFNSVVYFLFLSLYSTFLCGRYPEGCVIDDVSNGLHWFSGSRWWMLGLINLTIISDERKDFYLLLCFSFTMSTLLLHCRCINLSFFYNLREAQTPMAGSSWLTAVTGLSDIEGLMLDVSTHLCAIWKTPVGSFNKACSCCKPYGVLIGMGYCCAWLMVRWCKMYLKVKKSIV